MKKGSGAFVKKGSGVKGVGMVAFEKKALIQTAACQSMVGYDLFL